jgi:hypothetical protein
MGHQGADTAGTGNEDGQPPVERYARELEAFAADLRELRIECGNPSLREIEKAAPASRPLSASAVSEALAGKRLPRLDFTVALVKTLISFRSGASASRDHPQVERLRRRWQELERLRVSLPRRDRAGRTPSPTPPPAHPTGAVPGRGVAGRAVLAALKSGRLISLASLDHELKGGHLMGGQKLVSVAFSTTSGELLASADSGGKIQLWNPVTGRSHGMVLTGHTDPLAAMAPTPR